MFHMQGSVATHARCGGMFNIRATANLPRNLPVKKFVNPLRTDRLMVMSLWPCFLAHPVCLYIFQEIRRNDERLKRAFSPVTCN